MAVLWLEGVSRTSWLKSFVLCVWWGNTDILRLTVIKHTHGGCLFSAPWCNQEGLRVCTSFHSPRPQRWLVLALSSGWGQGLWPWRKGTPLGAVSAGSLLGRSCQVDVWTPQIFTQQMKCTALTRIKKEVTFCPWEQYSERLRTLSQKNWFWFRNQICRLNFFSWVKYEIKVTCKFPFLFSF